MVQSPWAKLNAIVSTLALAVASLVSTLFLFGSWAINAPTLGGSDFGMRLGLAFLIPLLIYTSLVLVPVSALGALVAWKFKWPIRRWFITLALSLFPILTLLARDAGLI